MRAHLIFILVSALALGATLTGCASNEEKDKSTEQQLYERAQRSLDGKNWQAAVSALELLEENFPFGTFGEQAQLELIYAHYQSGDYELSIANADRFIRLHPQHRHADYAYYMRGLASFNKESSLVGSIFGMDNTSRDPGAAINAFNMLSEFVTRYPSSDYAVDAQLRMVYLRNLLARGEIHIANYYFSRKAYLAAAARGRAVVENYQGSPAVPDGLASLIQAYHMLGQDELGVNAIKVLRENYPEYPALNEDGSFNYNYAGQLDKKNWISYLTLGLFNKQLEIGFDTRDIYNSMYKDKSQLEKTDAPRPTE
ncbi:outer membrane protein assembly factor BamD [Marinagarivorans cellulosilyticus]|uniref:Outer membrane protein assembly factor BamD n=1 Tax=Marinagarivorans cellulosilyticus TaxID=2721545 RepID=A0AAN2BLX2_9GAMM|nr:outer membrane protein assembly factor BamD [Marinagarivorans cellulosilyticus]BCD99465.1 outer membrane protein assembly factor BamD [Marinagarivorans cellulosilyticus]